MLIKEINTIPLRVPYADPDAGTASAHYLVLVRIETQSGLVGYGEALAYLPSMQAPLCAVLDTIVKPAALGKNAGAINSVIHDIEFEIAPLAATAWLRMHWQHLKWLCGTYSGAEPMSHFTSSWGEP